MDQPQASNEKKLTLILLCWLFGVFGIHRFYAGKHVSGTLQLLMLIFMGVLALLDIGIISAIILIGLSLWLVIDIMLIIMGKFTDKEGRPIVAWV